jgi:phage I-like protein
MDTFALTLAGQPVIIAALDDGQETSEIEIIPAGSFRLGDGRGAFTMPDPQAVIDASLAYAERNTGGELLVDFDHGAERKGVDDKRTAAAGWITALRHDAARGRIMATVRWTRAGREALAERAYRFISPVFAADKQNRVRGILRAGLTNQPAIGELRALAASTEGDGSMEELLQKLAAALGLEADAGEDKIIAAALGLIETGKNAEVVLAAAGIEGGLGPEEAEALAGKITAAAKGDAPDPARFVPKAAFDELSVKVAALEGDARQRDADALVAAAQAAGKLTPALVGWAQDYAAKDADGFAAWSKTAPVVCAAGAILTRKVATTEAGVLTDLEKQVCANMGITEEQFLARRDGTQPQKKEA